MKFEFSVNEIEPVAARCLANCFETAARQHPDNPLLLMLAEQLLLVADRPGAPHTISIDPVAASDCDINAAMAGLRVLQQGFIELRHRHAAGLCFLIIDSLFVEICQRFNHFPREVAH